MSPERWQKIESVFQTAVELSPADRDTFVENACADDQGLRIEVEKLLKNFDSAENFIESPVWTDSVMLSSSAKKDISDSFNESIEQNQVPDFSGEQIGPYRLVHEIGRGGMGAVYLADRADGEFRQRVAIKLIKRGMDSDYIIRRFRHERQILASFEHPFIARLLDGGTTKDGVPYFVMEYIDGETLYNYCDSKQLGVRERLKIFQKICSAIHYAHEKQIIHRDIKPSNILINRTATPKLLDFGIAKILDPNLIHESVNPTASMLRMMTPDYASPEQVRGDDVTRSSDIYSLGILLYELLTGHKPYNFGGRALHEISRVICDVMPELPSSVIKINRNLLPKYAAAKASFLDARATTEGELEKVLRGGLDDIVMKTVAKNPSDRYSSASDLSKDISRFMSGERIAAPRYQIRQRSEEDLFLQIPENSKAIAVLPFKFLNLGDSEDTDHKFLGLGLADALITRLSKVRRFIVRPTRSILTFSEGLIDPITAGRDLGVDYILDGNIKKAGNRLRTSVQLLNVQDNAAVWATSIDETISDVLTLEDTLANKVVEVLLPQLTGSELAEFSKRGTNVPEAFEQYLRGRYHFNSFTEEGFAKAFVSFHGAIAADPNYALAYTGIADYYNWLGIIGVLPPQECFQPAIQAASRAVEIDDELSEGHASLGFSLHAGNYDWSRAEHHLRRAIELNPSNASAYVWYSIVLYTEGRFDEALSFAERGVELDPLTPFNHHNVGWGLYFARRYSEAEARYEKVIKDFPNYNFGYYGLSKIHRIAGQTAKALSENEKANVLTGNSVFTQLSQAECLAASGQNEAARWKLAELEQLGEERYVSPYQLALAYSYLTDHEKALECLARARTLNESWLNWMGVEPVFDFIRADQRFNEILESIGYRMFFSNYSISGLDLHVDTAESFDRSNRSDGRLHDNTTLVIDESEKTDGGTGATATAARSGFNIVYGLVIGTLLVLLGASGYYLFINKPPGSNSVQRAPLTNPNIVILPFTTSDPERRSLGVGLADALASKLGSIKSLQIISASTGRAMSNLDDGQIAQNLNSPFVVRGEMEGGPNGDTILDASLVDTRDGRVVWSEKLRARGGDILSLERQLAFKILESLNIIPLPLERQRLERNYTNSESAYESYLYGRYLMTDRSAENLHRAVGAFQASVNADPNFALSYVGLADAWSLLNLYEIDYLPDAYPNAQEYARKALKLDDDLAEAHASMAYIKFYYERDRAGAELEFRRSIQLNPSYAQVHHWFALFLSYTKRPLEAINEAEIAQRLDPLSPSIKAAAAIVYFMDRRDNEALENCDKALSRNSDFVPALKVKRWVYTVQGERRKAIDSLQREMAASGGSLDDPGWKLIAFQVNPQNDHSAAVADVQQVADSQVVKGNANAFAFEVALAYNAIGETTRALDYLELSESVGSHSFNLAEVDPRLDNLRRLPRFQKLISKLQQPNQNR
jgi:serine/threonine protein kinase/tetratricopeptide (TPR) repeat protein